MYPDENLTKIINNKRYSVATATLIAHDAYWDGSNYERYGRNSFLYRTSKGAYFTVVMSQWEGEPYQRLRPITQQQAIELYENFFPEHIVTYEQAFPIITIEDA